MNNKEIKTLYIVLVHCACVFLSSCASPPKARITCITDSKVIPTSEEISFVFDVGKYLDPEFRVAFEKNIIIYHSPGIKKLELMPYPDFIQSAYNKPESGKSFSNHLFVFITKHGTSSYGYNITNIDYRLEVKYLDKEPLLVEEISLYCGDLFRCSSKKHASELVSSILNELKTRQILKGV